MDKRFFSSRLPRTRLVLLLFAAAAAHGAAAEVNPVRTHPHATAPATASQRFIVKLRAAALPAIDRAAEPAARLDALSSRSAVRLLAHRPITARLHALTLEPLAGESSAAVLARLRADPDVEYAVLDERRYIHGVPNDPLYAQQWYLQVAAATPSAVDAVDAWGVTTGSTSLVIADIDTGVRSDHPDLAGRLLPGYCFISDAFVANGGACPGPGADDPGDWVTSADISANPNECSSQTAAAASSWHGTRVAGLLGAATNNGAGVAGVTWGSPILPVRALGKCGGLDSDIISAMLWAGGVAVSGAPVNLNPARIINMSLGGTGSCPTSYVDAIQQLNALGVLVVASAGNEGGPVDAPANCPGVAGIAGLRQAGTKVGYSSLGPELALGAPAGNCGDSFTTAESACVYSMTTTTNLSAMSPGTPDANDYTGLYYCDATSGSYPGCTIAAGQYRTYSIGTSFSAPVVAGIAALMSTVNTSLNSCQLIARLKEGAQPYPQSSLDATGSQPPMCHVPASATDLEESECICTRDGQTCGAGMANAPGALTAALRPIAAVVVPARVTSGQTVTLDGSGSGAANGHSIASYQWSPVSGGLSLAITGAATAKASVTGPACGVGTVALTVTDDTGRTDTADVVITPSSAATTAPSTAGQSACAVSPPAITVAVCPASDSVQTGATETLTATLANTGDASVTWEVNGIVGGNATLGTITSAGIYSAPASVPAPATVTITAVSEADASATGTSQLTITAPAGGGGGGGGGGGLDPATLLAVAALATVRLLMRRRGAAPA